MFDGVCTKYKTRLGLALMVIKWERIGVMGARDGRPRRGDGLFLLLSATCS